MAFAVNLGDVDLDPVDEQDLLRVLHPRPPFGFERILSLLLQKPFLARGVPQPDVLGELKGVRIIAQIDHLFRGELEHLVHQRHLYGFAERLPFPPRLDVRKKLGRLFLESVPEQRYRLALEITHLAAAPSRQHSPLVLGAVTVPYEHLLLKLDFIVLRNFLTAVPIPRPNSKIKDTLSLKRTGATIGANDFRIARAAKQASTNVNISSIWADL